MATISSIIVRIGANSSQLRSELRRTNAELKSSFGESLALSRGLAMGIAAVGASFVALGAKAVQAAGSFQQVETAMTNMLGSAQEAQSLLAKLQDFAAKTPFEFNDVTQATQKFLAFGFTADQVIPTLRAVGDAAAGVGLGKEGIDRITIALGQMAAKSRVQSDEMLQLTEAGIPAWQMLADKIGTSVPQAMDMVTKGMVDAQTGLQALVGGMQERFGGMMDQQSQTVMGAWSNMMDGLSQSAIALGLQLSEALNLPDLFSTVGESLQEFAALVKDEGIPAALSKMIPPEVQIAAAGLATVLTVSTIPAIMEFGLQAKLAAVPLLGSFGKGLSAIKAGLLAIPPGAAAATSSLTLFKAASASAGASMAGLGTSLKAGVSALPQLITGFGRFLVALGPVGIAIGAVGVAIAAFLSSGHKLEDLLNVVPGTMESVKMAGESLKRLWGELGQAIANLVSASAPLIGLLATVFTASIYAIIAVINVFATVLSWILTIVSTIITAIIATFNMLYNKVSTALGKVGDALSNMADSILPSWASEGLKTIKGFVQTAMGWLNKLINKIFQTNNALSNAGNNMTPEERARRQANMETYQNAQTTADDATEPETPDYAQFKSAGDGGTDVGGGKAIGSGGSPSSKTDNYDPRAGAIYNAQALTGLSYGTGEGQVVCTTYIENAWSQAGVSNAWDLGPNANYWAQNAGGAFHAAGSGYVPKAGDVAITNDGEGDPQGHVIMIDENGTGYYAAGGSKGVSAHYDTDHRDAFDVYGYISMSEFAGFQDTGRSMTQRPQFNWDRSEYTQAIRAAATSYNLDPALLLAVAMRESGGDTIGGLTMVGGNGGGMMQILSPDQDISDGNGGRVRIGDLYQNYQTDILSNAMAGAAMLKDKIDANGGDTWAGVADYYGGADKADYAAKVKANYGKVQAEGASSGGNFVQQQAQYQKRMVEQAIQTHKQIDDSYAQSTATQAELVDRKYDKEREKLEESKAFNANYAKDKAKLDEMYAQEHLKAVEEDAMKEQQLRAKAQEIAGNIKTNAPAVTDTASTKALSKMEADYDKAIEGIRTKWQQYSVDYTSMTESQKAMFLRALDDEGVAYELAADGRLSFARQMYAEELAQYKAYLDEKNGLLSAGQGHRGRHR